MKTSSRGMLLVFGILLTIMGIILFATPIANSLFLTYLICILMLVFGVAEIVFYMSHRKGHVASGWVLADGIISAVLGLMLLFVPNAQLAAASIVFCVWVLFTGVNRTSAAFAAKDAGLSGWGWILAAGILGILLGVFMMFEPLLAIMVIGFVIPMSFVVQGVSAVAMFFATRH